MKIKPIRKICECNAKVINHHYYCDSCWGMRAKRRYNHKNRKIVYQEMKSRGIKLNIIKNQKEV
jgi:hypothetical protein